MNNGTSSLDAASITVKNELMELWGYAGYGDILHAPPNVLRKIKSLATTYKALSKTPTSRRTTDSFLKKESTFLGTLPKLFDITVESLRYSQLITAEDRDFLLNHWNKKISSTPDIPLKKAIDKKLQRQENRAAFYSKQGTSASYPNQPDPSPPSTAPSSPTSDTEYQPKRLCTTPRSTGTTVHLPRDILQKIGPTADRLGVSNNQLTAVCAAITNHGGGNIDNISLSKATCQRSRKVARADAASDIRDNFSCTYGQINFDGKLLAELDCTFKKVNRLAIVLAQEHENQILGIVKTDSSTGKVEAEAVKAALDAWNIAEKIIACGFDTTSSNTGVHKGCCTLLQELLCRQLLWLACRHHIFERILGATFAEFFGDTSGPEETFFKFLKTSWSSIDLSDIHLPDIPSFYRSDADSLLLFINHRLEPENAHMLPRCDYKEFLELAKLFLGGRIERKKGHSYQIQQPGADHHARWMSKAIYTLKLSFLQHQFPNSVLSWHKKRKVEKMALFIVFVYLESWFRSASLFSAGTNDLKLYARLQKFSKVHKKVSLVGTTVLQRHTWYLSEELVALSLFDESLPSDLRNSLAKKISSLPAADQPIQKPCRPVITPCSTLTEFVGPRTVVLFNILGIPHTFLADSEWHLLPQYEAAKAALKGLIPLNDSCERALALATTLNGTITRDEASYQDLILVVEAHRKKYGLKTKADLKKLY